MTSLSSYLGVVETLPEQDNLGDETRIRDHHGNGPEHALQVIGEFCSTSVTRVHRDEDTTGPHLQDSVSQYLDSLDHQLTSMMMTYNVQTL